MAFISREEALKRLRAQAEMGKPIVGCGAGTGISAKFAEAGGADLIIICLLYTSPSPRDRQKSRMPSSA
jgi:predicted TIM-barrel enzyme